MKLIDGEKLLDAAQVALDIMAAHEIDTVGAASLKIIIEWAPIVDAIPVAWLRRIADGMPESVERLGAETVLALWEEREDGNG